MQFDSPNYFKKMPELYQKPPIKTPKNFQDAKKVKENLKQGYVWLRDVKYQRMMEKRLGGNIIFKYR